LEVVLAGAAERGVALVAVAVAPEVTAEAEAALGVKGTQSESVSA
jgi:hypothetical protein